jgi:hypothetical protein
MKPNEIDQGRLDDDDDGLWLKLARNSAGLKERTLWAAGFAL